MFSTEQIADEFTGRGSYYFGEDISVGKYLERLKSIYERIELFPEEVIQNKMTKNVADPVENVGFLN